MTLTQRIKAAAEPVPKVEVTPLPDEGLLNFDIYFPGEIAFGCSYTKTWWRGYWHGLVLIFKGWDVKYQEPYRIEQPEDDLSQSKGD
jgi:hypothetical protein